MIESKKDLNMFIDNMFSDKRVIDSLPNSLSGLENGDTYNEDGANPTIVAIIRGDSYSGYRDSIENYKKIVDETDSPLVFFKMTKTNPVPFEIFEYIENWMGCFDTFSRVSGDKSDMLSYYKKSIENLRNFPMTTMISTENLGKIITNMTDAGVLTPRSMRNREKLCRGGASDWSKRLNGSPSDHRMWVTKSIK